MPPPPKQGVVSPTLLRAALPVTRTGLSQPVADAVSRHAGVFWRSFSRPHRTNLGFSPTACASPDRAIWYRVGDQNVEKLAALLGVATMLTAVYLLIDVIVASKPRPW